MSKSIGRFENAAIIGEGMSSSVYRAYDSQLESEIAIKVLRPHLAQDAISVLRFKREIELSRELKHPNIIKIYDLFAVDQTLALTMEFLKGQSLSEFIKIQGGLPWDTFHKIFGQLISAMKYCHNKKVIHRDIKPQNIFVDADLRVTILDFGISRITTMSDLTQTGTSLGTPEYMAPELYTNSFFDPRSDIYALGVVAYEMLTGQLPFQGESLYILFEKQTNSAPTPIRELCKDVPSWMENVISKMLSNNIVSRYQSVSEIEFDFNEGRFFDNSANDVQQAACLKCQQLTPISFSVCLNCGFSPMTTIANSDKTFSVFISPNNQAAPLKAFLGSLNFHDPVTLIRSKPIKLISKVPSSLVPIVKLHAQTLKVNIYEQKESWPSFIRANLILILSGFALLLPYAFGLAFLLKTAKEYGAAVYYSENAVRAKPEQMIELTLSGIIPALNSILYKYVYLTASVVPILAIVICLGLTVAFMLKVVLLFQPAKIRNWKEAFGTRARSFDELNKCLQIQSDLKFDEHRAWGKKFLLMYVQAVQTMEKKALDYSALFALITSTLEILSLMDTIRRNIAGTEKNHSKDATEVLQLEELYSDAAVRLMTMDSLLSRINRNAIDQDKDVLVSDMVTAKESLSDAAATLQTLRLMNLAVRQAA